MTSIFILYTEHLDAYHILGNGARLFTVAWVRDGWRELISRPRLSGGPIIVGGDRSWPTKRAALDALMGEHGYTIGRLLDGNLKWEVLPAPPPVPGSGSVAAGPMEDAPLVAPSAKVVRSTPELGTPSSLPLLRKKKIMRGATA